MTDLSNRSTLRIINDDIRDAFEIVGKKYGISIKIGTGSYEPDGSLYNGKFTCLAPNANGDIITKEAKDYTDNAEWLGLKTEWLNKKVRYLGDTLEITGYKPRRTKYPISMVKSAYEESGK